MVIYLLCRRPRFNPWGWEDSLEKGMATHSSILAWRITWTEEPGGLQSMGSQSQIQLNAWACTHRWNIYSELGYLIQTLPDICALPSPTPALHSKVSPWQVDLVSRVNLNVKKISVERTSQQIHRPALQSTFRLDQAGLSREKQVPLEER